MKSLLTGNKSRNKHVFWSMVRWGRWWQQRKTQKKDKHIGLVHGLNEKIFLTRWHFKLIDYKSFLSFLSTVITCPSNCYICLLVCICVLIWELFSVYHLCLWICFIKHLQMLSGCLCTWQFDSLVVWSCADFFPLLSVQSICTLIFPLLYLYKSMLWEFVADIFHCTSAVKWSVVNQIN